MLKEYIMLKQKIKIGMAEHGNGTIYSNIKIYL